MNRRNDSNIYSAFPGGTIFQSNQKALIWRKEICALQKNASCFSYVWLPNALPPNLATYDNTVDLSCHSFRGSGNQAGLSGVCNRGVGCPRGHLKALLREDSLSSSLAESFPCRLLSRGRCLLRGRGTWAVAQSPMLRKTLCRIQCSAVC